MYRFLHKNTQFELLKTIFVLKNVFWSHFSLILPGISAFCGTQDFFETNKTISMLKYRYSETTI